MILALPTQTEQESRAELAAIREAGKRIVASPERRREFLEVLGFGKPGKGKSSPKIAAPKPAKPLA